MAEGHGNSEGAEMTRPKGPPKETVSLRLTYETMLKLNADARTKGITLSEAFERRIRESFEWDNPLNEVRKSERRNMEEFLGWPLT